MWSNGEGVDEIEGSGGQGKGHEGGLNDINSGDKEGKGDGRRGEVASLRMPETISEVDRV